ncbi:MAG: cytoplasmic protein [Deltaproteobacteria bacterium]|nr:cytoplasmic protein [Candidatus Anaeroferrophillus wilburensis]MBN2889189.1 cytoplasmic protein [Deltaproteobacteria bacterium]
MLKNDLILRNPLNVLGGQSEDVIEPGQLGAILSRAGVGKTSMLIQIALNALLRQKNVLHVSFEDPVRKVNLWYKEVVQDLADQYKIEQTEALWETILPHRFIMTFANDGFSAARLEERVNELLDQDIFTPQVLLVDGLPFVPEMRTQLKEMKDLAARHGMQVWFTVRIHRHEQPTEDGLPVQLQDVDDLFNVLLLLQPDGKDIYVKALKGQGDACADTSLQLDPATMLLKIK